MTDLQRVIAFSWMLFFFQYTFGQKAPYTVDHLSVVDGLSDHRIYTGASHETGYLWLGTEDGLNRFDGYEFLSIPGPDFPEVLQSPFSDRIVKIWNCLDGMFLIGWGDFLLPDKFFYLYDPKASLYHRVEMIDRQPNQFTFSSVFGKFIIKTNEHQKNINNLKSNGRLIDEIGNEMILTSGEGHKSKVQIKIKDADTIDISDTWHSLVSPNGIFSKNFASHIYISTQNGLVKTTFNRLPFKNILSQNISTWEYSYSGRNITRLNQDTLLFATEYDGVGVYNEQTGTSNLVDNFLDKEGKKLKMSRNIRGLYRVDDHTAWIISYFGPAIFYDFKNQYGRTIDWNMTHIYATYFGEDKMLHILSQDEKGNRILTVYDMYSKEVERMNFSATGRAKCLIKDKEGRLWVGGQSGINVLDLDRKQRRFTIGNQPMENKIGHNALENDVLDIPHHPILKGANIIHLFDNGRGEILAGTENSGVHIIRKKDLQVTTYTVSDGLPDNSVCGIGMTDHGYWFSTYHGLSYFDTTEKVFRNFYSENGLPHNEFNRYSTFQDKNGDLYMGTMNGFVHFQPDEILSVDREIGLMLAGASYFNRSGNEQILDNRLFSDVPSFNIPSANRSCSFKLSTTDLSNDPSYTYAYRLVPMHNFTSTSDIPWTQNGADRTIQFEYLPSGKYELHVRGNARTGVFKTPLIIQLRVREFFYRTWWFITGLIFSALGLGYLFYRNRLENALRIERLKTKLSSDLHDDVGSVLSGVAYQMELLEFSVADKNKSLVQQIAESSRRAMSQMRDVVWAIDARKGSIQDLAERMKEFADEILEPLEINCHFDIRVEDAKKGLSSEIRHGLLSIFKEFLTNTVKHSGATSILVRMIQKDHHLQLQIKDNGRGMKNKNTTGQGMLNMHMRAEKMGSKLLLDREQGFGVALEVNIK